MIMRAYLKLSYYLPFIIFKMKVISAILLSLLLVAAFAQDDINVQQKRGGRKTPKTGGWSTVDVNNF